ncbi:eosinophil peroxidase-like [Anarrhichthys ocellatus]|uniref:eosinophil peroxidase-like n=1 Tax=Anarrhichthys ocellatus TaxID=433405 RepID=UPI0012EECFDC|nr:eosinophil peroxidase-like [Anarrhichthys ocellatus]
MKWLVCLIAAGLYLCLKNYMNTEPARLSRSVIEKAVIDAKTMVDSAYEYSRRVSVERVRRDAVSPSDTLRLLKQPVGQTRNAVRAADYMHNAVKLIQMSLQRHQQPFINATDLISEEDMQFIADRTGCFSQHRAPSCKTTPNLGRFRTASSICNNRCVSDLKGDERSNEQIGLTALHTLFLREHNRLVYHLAQLNTHWDGERLYQEARKIMGGYSQVLTFREYLGHIVGPDFIASHLSTYPGYDEHVDPSISNVFATAAYRFAHLMVQPHMFRLNEMYEEHPVYPSPLLHKAFFTPWRIVFEGGVDPIIRGLVGRPAKLNTQDHMMSDELRDRLFKFTSQLALDLAALNMQRGRDHGLPGYNKWRKFCGLTQPRNLEELAEVLNNTEIAEKLLDLYKTPDNIDVWLGGVAEPFVPGGRVGPLFACLIARQFQQIRQGDRLWWENNGVFTEAQKKSLRETLLARIICDNTGITEVPKNPFLYRPRGYGYTRCENIPAFDLSPWNEDDPHGPSAPTGPYGPPGPHFTFEQVAFSMRLGNDMPQAGMPLHFSEAIYNGQNSYNPKTGMFTSPHPGVYEFQFHCTIFQKDGSIDLMRNEHLIVHSFTTWQTGYLTASGNTYIKLNKGDHVYLVANHDGNGLTHDCFFSGHFLFSE